MSQWFRLYESLLDDPKVQRLKGDHFKAWVNMLALASRNDGVLPSVSDVGFALRVSEEKATEWVEALVSVGLLDAVDGRHEPHNWASRQYKSDSSAERMRRHRERHKNADVTGCDGDGDVTVTSSESEQNRTEQNRGNLDAEVAFEAFCILASRFNWPKPSKLTPERKTKLKARLSENGGIPGWEAALSRAQASSFINATDASWWSFDWLLKPANFAKVIEGNYDNRSTDPPGKSKGWN